MGWNIQGKTNFDYAKGKEYGTTNTRSNTNYSNNATFRPEGQATLDALAGIYGNVGQSANQANNFYSRQLEGGAVNPYIENMVAGQNALANQDFSSRLAQVRSGGFRGGAGRDTINQGMFASDFTNQQYANNQKTFADAFTQSQNEKYAAANALGQNQQLAMQLLALLRGEEGQQSTQSTSDYTKYFKNQSQRNEISGGYGTGQIG